MDFKKLNILKPLLKEVNWATKASTNCRLCGVEPPQGIKDIISNYEKREKEVADYFFSLLPEALQKYCIENNIKYKIYADYITEAYMALELKLGICSSYNIKWDMEGNMYLSKYYAEKYPEVPIEGIILDSDYFTIFYKFDK